MFWCERVYERERKVVGSPGLFDREADTAHGLKVIPQCVSGDGQLVSTQRAALANSCEICMPDVDGLELAPDRAAISAVEDHARSESMGEVGAERRRWTKIARHPVDRHPGWLPWWRHDARGILAQDASRIICLLVDERDAKGGFVWKTVHLLSLKRLVGIGRCL